MRPIEGYEQITEAGEFKPLVKGIYPLIIKDAVEVADKEYLTFSLDIVKGEFKDYFKNIGLNYIRSYKENALPFFKAFMTAVEKSNSGYIWNWEEKTLINKYVMGVFGEEEYVANDGTIKVKVVLVECRSVEAFKEGKIKIPELKKLTQEQINERLSQLKSDFPMNAEPAPQLLSDDDLPF